MGDVITRRKPLTYRGYRIHNETISTLYNIYDGPARPSNLRGYAYRTLNDAKAAVDRWVTNGHPLIDDDNARLITMLRGKK